MDFTCLERQLLTICFGERNAELAVAGGVPTDGFELRDISSPERDDDDNMDENSALAVTPVSMAAVLMVAKGIGDSGTLDLMNGIGHSTLVRVEDADWGKVVSSVVFRLMRNADGVTFKHPRNTVLSENLAVRGTRFLVSDSDPESGFDYSRVKSERDTDLQTLMVAVSANRGLVLVTAEEDRPTSLETRAACDLAIDVRKLDRDAIAKLTFIFYPAGAAVTDAVVPSPISPLTLVFAFRPGTQVDGLLDRLALNSPAPTTPKRKLTTIDDIYGASVLKEWGENLKADVDAVRSGKLDISEISRGALVSGPPGVGKSKAARVIAEHADIPLVLGSVGRWLGSGEGHLGSFLVAMRRAFAEASRHEICLLAIDEIDGIPARGREDTMFWDAAVAGLLEAIDGTDTRPGTVIMGLCNSVDGIDRALTRSGRLEHHIRVELPTRDDLASMIAMCLRPDLQDIDFSALAARLNGATVADVDRICKDARRRARRERRSITLDDLTAIVDHETLPDNDQRAARTAVHEAGHAIVAYLNEMKVHHVTLLPLSISGELGSVTAEFANWQGTLAEVRAIVQMLLAGHAAETIEFGAPAIGSGSDLEKATKLLHEAFSHEGLGRTKLWHTVPPRHLDLHPRLAAEIEAELDACYARAVEVLTLHLPTLHGLRDVLVEKRFLDADEVVAFLSRSITCNGAEHHE